MMKKYLFRTIIFLALWKNIFCNFAEDIFSGFVYISQGFLDIPFGVLNQIMKAPFYIEKLTVLNNVKITMATMGFMFAFLLSLKEISTIFLNNGDATVEDETYEKINYRNMIFRIVITFVIIINYKWIVGLIDALYEWLLMGLREDNTKSFLNINQYMNQILTSKYPLLIKSVLLSIAVIFSMYFGMGIFFLVSYILIYMIQASIIVIFMPLFFSTVACKDTEDIAYGSVKKYIGLKIMMLMLIMGLKVIGEVLTGGLRPFMVTILETVLKISKGTAEYVVDIIVVTLCTLILIGLVIVIYKAPHLISGLFKIFKEKNKLKGQLKNEKLKLMAEKKLKLKEESLQKLKSKQKIKADKKNEFKTKLADILKKIRSKNISGDLNKNKLTIGDFKELIELFSKSYLSTDEIGRMFSTLGKMSTKLKIKTESLKRNVVSLKEKQKSLEKQINEIDEKIKLNIKRVKSLEGLSELKREYESKELFLEAKKKELLLEHGYNKKFQSMEEMKNDVWKQIGRQLKISSILIDKTGDFVLKSADFSSEIASEISGVNIKIKEKDINTKIEKTENNITKAESKIFLEKKHMEKFLVKKNEIEMVVANNQKLYNESIKKIETNKIKTNAVLKKFRNNTKNKKIKQEINKLKDFINKNFFKIEDNVEKGKNNESKISDLILDKIKKNKEIKDEFLKISSFLKKTIRESEIETLQNLNESNNFKNNTKDMEKKQIQEEKENFDRNKITNIEIKELEIYAIEEIKKKSNDTLEKKISEISILNIKSEIALKKNDIQEYSKFLNEKEKITKEIENSLYDKLSENLTDKQKSTFKINMLENRMSRELGIINEEKDLMKKTVEEEYEKIESKINEDLTLELQEEQKKFVMAITIQEKEEALKKIESINIELKDKLKKLNKEKERDVNIKIQQYENRKKEITQYFKDEISKEQEKLKVEKLKELHKATEEKNRISIEINKLKNYSIEVGEKIEKLKNISEITIENKKETLNYLNNKKYEIDRNIRIQEKELYSKLNEIKTINKEVIETDNSDTRKIQNLLKEEMEKENKNQERIRELQRQLQLSANNLEENNNYELIMLKKKIEQEKNRLKEINQDLQNTKRELIKSKKIYEKSKKELELCNYYTQELRNEANKRENKNSLLGGYDGLGLNNNSGVFSMGNSLLD